VDAHSSRAHPTQFVNHKAAPGIPDTPGGISIFGAKPDTYSSTTRGRAGDFASRTAITLSNVLILLSPAKALDFATPVPKTVRTLPRLLDESAALAEVMKAKSVTELARLSSISDELAALNAERWANFTVPFPAADARAAIFGFNGDAYHGLAARQRFGTADFTEAQKTLRILSGLYGVLRPLDLIMAYRLEMGTRVATERGNNLYQWWGDQITAMLRADLAAAPGAPVVVNLASAEYFAAVRPDELGARVITPRFEDTDARGRRSVVSFYAKRARGEMAAWLITQRARNPKAVRDFDRAGYRYDRASSRPDQPVFVRSLADCG
jgi:uncharacterized protein